MESSPLPITHQVTLVVFKDNHHSRTFQLTHGWIQRFGLLIAFNFLLAAVSLILALRYYSISKKLDFASVQNLQDQIRSLEDQLRGKDHPAEEPFEPEALTSAKNQPGTLPIRLFSTPVGPLLPEEISQLPFSVQSQKMTWTKNEGKKKTLKVHFAIQYQKTDQGHQQGRILILARNKNMIMSYPPGTLQSVGTENLLSYEKGEFFSVSRYREVNAEIGPISSQDQFDSIEIFLFNKEGKIIYYQTLTPIVAENQTQATPVSSASDLAVKNE